MSNARKLADNLPIDGQLGNRNLIINGGMTISQRIDTTATAITGGNYGLDRWLAYYDGNSYTTQQVADAPSGFYNSMKLLVTGTTTPNYSFFGHKLEGNDVNPIGLGTANCKSFTISFYVKSSVTGVYSIAVGNNAGNLGYPVQYTINSANTWERKTMTIPPITSGTWEVGSSTGIFLRFNMGSPSSRTDTAGGWRSGNLDGADGSTGAVTWATTSGASFYITGCQLEVGSQSTPFEHEPVSVTLDKCYRYCHIFKTNDTNGVRNIHQDRLTTTYIGNYFMPVEMRVAPTVTQVGMDRVHKPGIRYDTVSSGPNFYFIHTQGFNVTMSVTNNDVDSQTTYFGAVSGGTVTADAEL